MKSILNANLTLGHIYFIFGNNKIERLRMKNKYILLIATSLVLVVLVSVGISYALWNQNIAAENVNTANTGCFDISLNDEKNNINLANAYPISTEKGSL